MTWTEVATRIQRSLRGIRLYVKRGHVAIDSFKTNFRGQPQWVVLVHVAGSASYPIREVPERHHAMVAAVFDDVIEELRHQVASRQQALLHADEIHAEILQFFRSRAAAC